MAGFMAQNPLAPDLAAALGLTFHSAFETQQARVRDIERHSDTRNAIRREPFGRKPDMRSESDTASLKSFEQLVDISGDRAVFEPQTQIAESELQQVGIVEVLAPDGTPLTDLAGYKLYWGTTPGSYPNSVTIDNPSVTTYVVDNLAPGTYEFVATSYNASGVESRYSGAATKVIP